MIVIDNNVLREWAMSDNVSIDTTNAFAALVEDSLCFFPMDINDNANVTVTSDKDNNRSEYEYNYSAASGWEANA